MNMLRGLDAAETDITTKRNTILIFSADGSLEMRSFRDATDALRALFQLEKTSPEKDVVLVRADTSDEIRIAFKNYFSDAREFIQLIERGCTKLSGKKVLERPRSRRRKKAAA
jgi:putative GTP pyrophosphokinase